MIAWHGKTDLKARTYARVHEHWLKGQIHAGFYWDGDHGCYLGCLTHCKNDPHRKVETLWGIPISLNYLVEAIFEKLPPKDNATFALHTVKSIQVGADLAGVWGAHFRWLLENPTNGLVNSSSLSGYVRRIVRDTIGLLGPDFDDDACTQLATRCTESMEGFESVDIEIVSTAKGPTRDDFVRSVRDGRRPLLEADLPDFSALVICRAIASAELRRRMSAVSRAAYEAEYREAVDNALAVRAAELAEVVWTPESIASGDWASAWDERPLRQDWAFQFNTMFIECEFPTFDAIMGEWTAIAVNWCSDIPGAPTIQQQASSLLRRLELTVPAPVVLSTLADAVEASPPVYTAPQQ